MARKKKAPTLRKKRRPSTVGDVALVVGMTDDREGYHIMRRRSEQHPVEFGTLRPLRDGKPLLGGGEILSLRARKDFPFLHDVKVEVDAQVDLASTRPTDGPALVANNDYRRGWDLVFGHATRDGGRAARLN